MNLGDVNPLSALQSLVIAIVIAVVMFAAGFGPGYFIGKAHGREETAESVGALKTSVDSCNVAADAAAKAAQEAKASSDDLERRITGVIQGENTKLARSLGTSRDRAMTYTPKGNTECERTLDVVRSQLMGAR